MINWGKKTTAKILLNVGSKKRLWYVQHRKWSPTTNDPETANDPQNGPQMILDRKWSLKSTANDPVKTLIYRNKLVYVLWLDL